MLNLKQMQQFQKGQGVYVLMEGDAVRYVGASCRPWERMRMHRRKIPFTHALYAPVRGGWRNLMNVERKAIKTLLPSHNRKDNPSPKIARSVTTAFKNTCLYRICVDRETHETIRVISSEQNVSSIEILRGFVQAGLASYEKARENGMKAKNPPTPRDGRFKRSK